MSFLTSPVAKDLINEWSYRMVLYQFRSDHTLGLNWTNYISISAIKKQTNIYFLHQKHKTIKKLSNFSMKNELWSNSLWETGLETIDKSNEHWYVVCIRDPRTVRSETEWSFNLYLLPVRSVLVPGSPICVVDETHDNFLFHQLNIFIYFKCHLFRICQNAFSF